MKQGNSGDTSSRQGNGTAVVVLFVFAFFFWIGMLDNVSDAHRFRASANPFHFAGLFGALAYFGLWPLLGTLLIVTANRRFTLWTGTVAATVLVAAAIGTSDAIGIYDYDQPWAMWLVFLLPAMVAARAFIPSLWLAAAAVLLSAVPIILSVADVYPKRERTAHLERVLRGRPASSTGYAMSGERAVQAFAKLGPDSKMGDYLVFLDSGLEQEALESIRKIKSRQADTVALLRAGRLRNINVLRKFDIAPAPDLCTAYSVALTENATRIDPGKRKRDDYSYDVIAVEAGLPDAQWLVAGGCDLKAPLAQLEKNLRATADIPYVTKLADEVAKLGST